MSDYRKFKTPFYEIEISDPTGSRKVKLPHHILRLVDRIKIVDGFNSNVPNTISIDIVEGSREPAVVDPAEGTRGLYKLNDSISGSITNRVGAITDLRFSGNSGITFFNDEERRLGRIDDRPQKNIRGKIVTRSHKNENKLPLFLFQERNLIKVTFGYLEDRNNSRSVVGRIVMFATDYPEAGPIRSTITATSTETFLDQIAPASCGVNLGKDKPTGTNNKIKNKEDITTTELLNELCDRIGILPSNRIISDDLLATKEEKDKAKVITLGQTFKNFMDQLAIKHNCYWRMIPTENGQDKLFFIKKIDLESELILNEPQLFTYKSPGSIILNVKIKADFGTGYAESKSSLSNDGKPTNCATNNTDGVDPATTTMFTGEKVANINPINDIQVCKRIVDQIFDSDFRDRTIDPLLADPLNFSSGAEVLPTTSDEKHDKDVATADANDKISRTISLEMTCLGHTKIIPGVLEILGIGSRYSGKYRIMSVEHTISSSGYQTKVAAITSTLAQGGVVVKDAVKGKESKKSDSGLFTPERENSTAAARAKAQAFKKKWLGN